jgi:hypothetical protein
VNRSLEAVDLIAFVNRPYAGLDPDIHPDQYTLAEIALERFHSHVGTFRRTKGDRAQGIASDMGHYLLPFAVELAAARGRAGAASRTCGSLRPSNCSPSCPATSRCRPRPWPPTAFGAAPSPACGSPWSSRTGLCRRRGRVLYRVNLLALDPIRSILLKASWSRYKQLRLCLTTSADNADS